MLRTQLPIRMPGLGHVNCYLLEDERGVAVVDPGLPGPKPWKDLTARLAQAGVPLRRIHTVIVTHSHPDHFGGAARLRREGGAEILTHRAFGTRWDPAPSDDVDATPPPGPPELEAADPVGRRSTPPTAAQADAVPTDVHPPAGVLPPPDDPRSTMPRRSASPGATGSRFTPRATPPTISACSDPSDGTFLSGDHVLPTITPHIGALEHYDDPLATFFASLDKVAELDQATSIVLPAHGHPFADLAERAEQIKVHHLGRLDKLRTTSAELARPASVMEFSTHLFKPRSLGPMADSETYAHLEHLRIAGEAHSQHVDGVLEYVIG